jgi:hypothetical protein
MTPAGNPPVWSLIEDSTPSKGAQINKKDKNQNKRSYLCAVGVLFNYVYSFFIF